MGIIAISSFLDFSTCGAVSKCDFNMMPRYDLEKIKAGIDEKKWERAVGLYKEGKVTEFDESPSGYTALVLGASPYDTAVSEVDFNQGDCSCFMGSNGSVCKHMVALAIWAVKRGAPIKEN
jgi:uncharacterized Zn finger protein